MLMNAVRGAYYRLPDQLQRHVLVLRREAIWRRAGIVFIHIPKAAGTSINEALYGQFMGHVRAMDIRRWGSRSLKALPSFAITRNPWDRLVSAYRFVRVSYGIGGRIQAGMHRPEQYRIPQFETFERFVTEWLAQRDITRLDGVFQPQALFVCDQLDRIIVDHIGRMEDLTPTISLLSEHLGRPPNIGRSNRSGEEVDYRDYYTPELAILVRDIYARDIEIFGYAFDERTDPPL